MKNRRLIKLIPLSQIQQIILFSEWVPKHKEISARGHAAVQYDDITINIALQLYAYIRFINANAALSSNHCGCQSNIVIL